MSLPVHEHISDDYICICIRTCNTTCILEIRAILTIKIFIRILYLHGPIRIYNRMINVAFQNKISLGHNFLAAHNSSHRGLICN